MSEKRLFNSKYTGLIVSLAGLFVFVLYLYFFVPFGDFMEKIRHANPIYYSLAFVAMVSSVAFYSLTWQRLLHLLQVRSSFLKAFQLIWVGSFVDLLIPTESVSGDISRVYLMTKNSNENPGKVVASVIGHRIVAMLITLAGLFMSSIYFVVVYRPSMLVMEFIGFVGGGTFASMILIFYLSRKRGATQKLAGWIIGLLVRFSRGRLKSQSLTESADKTLKAFHDGIDNLSVHPRRLILPASLALTAWFLDLLVAVFVFHAIGTTVSFSAIVIVYSVSVALQGVPTGIPGEIGILDVVMTSLYTLLGIQIAVSAVATVLIRALTLWIRLLIGAITVQWLGIKGLGVFPHN
jgi:uncharacterized protein (TIRG00374 family)